MNRSKLGPILKQLRISKGHEQKDYAKALGITPSQLSKIERGQHEPLESTTLRMIIFMMPELKLYDELLKLDVEHTYGNTVSN